MNELTLNIETDNAAFEGAERGPELARILRKLADQLDADDNGRDGYEWHLSDVNGNKVGIARIEAREAAYTCDQCGGDLSLADMEADKTSCTDCEG